MKIFLFTLLISISQSLFSQGQIEGKISSKKIPVEFASLGVEGAKYGTTTNKKGDFVLSNLPFGTHLIKVSHLSFNDTNFKVTLTKEMPLLRFNIAIKENSQELDEFVITGTRTEKRKTESAIIVNVINSKTLDNVQACNLSEGLKFQPGLRVETDCQTCNYTQLRINGLAGGYSQILINGRPIFSPLTSLYGLEQIPVNMIDRVEVIRGGGSSLYGSSAIGGTVNVITKIPKENNYELNFLTQSVNQLTSDNIFSGNGTLLTKKKNAGVSIFLNQRKREAYDHNKIMFRWA